MTDDILDRLNLAHQAIYYIWFSNQLGRTATLQIFQGTLSPSKTGSEEKPSWTPHGREKCHFELKRRGIGFLEIWNRTKWLDCTNLCIRRNFTPINVRRIITFFRLYSGGKRYFTCNFGWFCGKIYSCRECRS